MKKSEKAKYFVLGALVMGLVFSFVVPAVAAATTTKKNVDVYYGYTVYVDNVKFEPTDKNGAIEPFNYNGWIYAPFEHIAKALGKSVRWDADTRSLYISGGNGSAASVVKYYADYPTVPDFGVFVGAELIPYLSKYEYNYTGFVYDIYTNDAAKKYCDLLISEGFEYDSEYNMYIKGNYAIIVNTREYGTSLFIGFVSSQGVSDNFELSSSLEYIFPLHIYSNDGKTYLGKCVTDKYDSESINNPYGDYGSKYQTNSIFNEYGNYGSKYSNTSAFNERASEPPKIVDNEGKFIAYLTENKSITPRMTYVELDRLIRDNGQ
ncbi:MAG: copper amine oxidase N-terminal domain-containing protein [Oscillospiraceae bacterium]|nr:copper amine oxidase N-terminal domain-containing protein [Oscillospiraceae bacterium]